MAKTFSAALTAAKNRTHSPDPLIWLYRIEIDGTPANDLRLADYHEDLVYDQGDGSGAVTWTASNLALQDISEQAGALAEARITVQNVDRDAADRIEGGEIMNRRVTALLVSRSDLTTDIGHHDELSWSVRKATVSMKVVTFELGQFPYLVFLCPRERYSRDYCVYVHEGPNPVFDGRCGATATLTTCDKSFEGAAGCRGNGNQARYGAQPEMLFGNHPLLP